MFQRQAEVYEAMGMRAWADGLVPWRATTSPLLADVEADLIAAFAVDLGRREPLPVFDVGAGTGRLGFHLAPRLASRGVHARLHLTDVVGSNVEALAAQPQLAELARTGRVSFSRFDALHPPPHEGPAVLLAHYLFDSLPHRAVRVTSTGCFEGLLDDETWSWSYRPVERPGVLADSPPGTWLLPVGAIEALAAWRAAFSGPLLVLAADKGVTPRGPTEDPLLARHESVSAGVNFEALARGAPQWRHLPPARPHHGFELHAFTTHATPQLDEAWRRRGARNEVLELLTSVDATLAGAPDVDALLALAETSLADGDLLARLQEPLRRAPLAPAQVARLMTLLLQAARGHFLFRQHLDVPFALAALAHHLGALELASALYRLSLEESGPHPSTLVNLALAQDALGHRDLARQAAEAALSLEPEHPRATELLTRWR